MASSKPALVIVHGAWHCGAHFANVTSALQKEGYEVSAPDLPSVSTTPVENALAQDAATIKQAINHFIDAGKNVVVMMHSYGGVCGSEGVAEACEALKVEHASNSGGSRGRITHLFYVTAILLDKGTTVMDAGLTIHALDIDGGLIYHLEPYNRFYNATASSRARTAIDLIKPIAMESFMTPTVYEGWKDYDIPVTYLLCERDMALLLDSDQKIFEKRLKGAALRDLNMPKIDADHSPWLSAEDEFMKILRGILAKSA